ncbi:NRDE family protein [Dyadobacter sp. CY347]|uniref:NRDE family protein n=1 Tax=Dyadobacter sp. CY347 TaxID=2909336 RepID=UPI001F3CCD1B|nr:NRDE family protein [Dyadobacter sp. CY347]MCF2488268.1 NRDE family protein [Dyadobacter sp. CY347]
MCTVTYIWANGKAIITSNRDEHVNRPASLPLQPYIIHGKRVTFPKDPQAGGTWFAVDEAANVGVLLNGAASRHISKGSYAKSRGLVLLDIITGRSPIESWDSYDLTGIEPFTIVLLQQGDLYQLRWDFVKKETIKLNANGNHIWSSSTLYAKEIQEEREQWLLNFLADKEDIHAEDMKHFHMYAGNGNEENGLVINRSDIMKTFSITQTVIEQNEAELFHYDLLEEESFPSHL